MRKHYLDNLRLFTVSAVVVYHAAYLFNGQGLAVGKTAGHSIEAFDIFASSVYPWFMVLLFLIAGMTSRFSLERRGAHEFIRERTDRLLVPSTLGLFVFHIWTGYFNMKNAGADFDVIPPSVRPFIIAISGTGVLWFIQMLWLFSLLILIVRRASFLDIIGKKSGYMMIVLYSFVIYLSAQVLNTPVILVYRFGIYFASYILGFFVFSDDSVMDKVEQGRFFYLSAAVFFYAIYISRFRGLNYTEDNVLKDIVTNLYAYFFSISLLGIFRHYADRTGKLLDYLSKAEFGLYVFHYPLMVTSAYYLADADLPYIINYMIVIAIGFSGSICLYEAIRRIPFYRYAVLGIRKNKLISQNQ